MQKPATVYITLDSAGERLTVDGPLALFEQLLNTMRPRPPQEPQTQESSTDGTLEPAGQ